MKPLYYFIFIFSFTNCFAQDAAPGEVSDMVKISIINPGVSYEHRMAKYQSLTTRVFVTTLAGIGYSSSFGWTWQFNFDPTLNVQYRLYYNSAKRYAKGKNTELNNLNYVAPVFELALSKGGFSSNYYVENNLRPVYAVGALWGIQRNYKRHFSLDFNIGPGFLFSKDKVYIGGEKISRNVSEFTLLGQFTLGFWLNKRE